MSREPRRSRPQHRQGVGPSNATFDVAFINARLAGLAIRLWKGDARVYRVLERFATDVHRYGTQFTATGPSGVRCGFELGHDPVTQAVQMGFFFAGPYWPRVFPGLLREVNRRWKEETRRR